VWPAIHTTTCEDSQHFVIQRGGDQPTPLGGPHCADQNDDSSLLFCRPFRPSVPRLAGRRGPIVERRGASRSL